MKKADETLLELKAARDVIGSSIAAFRSVPSTENLHTLVLILATGALSAVDMALEALEDIGPLLAAFGGEAGSDAEPEPAG